MTPATGLIAEKQGIALACVVPLAAYIFIAVYAFMGANLRPRAEVR